MELCVPHRWEIVEPGLPLRQEMMEPGCLSRWEMIEPGLLPRWEMAEPGLDSDGKRWSRVLSPEARCTAQHLSRVCDVLSRLRRGYGVMKGDMKDVTVGGTEHGGTTKVTRTRASWGSLNGAPWISHL